MQVEKQTFDKGIDLLLSLSPEFISNFKLGVFSSPKIPQPGLENGVFCTLDTAIYFCITDFSP